MLKHQADGWKGALRLAPPHLYVDLHRNGTVYYQVTTLFSGNYKQASSL